MNTKVTLGYAALTTIIRHGLRFASNASPSRNWQECMGFLLGHDDLERKTLFVSRAIPMTHGSLVEVEFDTEHYAQADKVNQSLTDKEWVVGWYHTHPGHGLFLSDVDKTNQAGYQSLRETAVALVFDPSELKRGADFRNYIRVYQLDNLEQMRESGYIGIENIWSMCEFREVENIWVKSDFSEVADAIRETSEAALRNRPLIMEMGEKI